MANTTVISARGFLNSIGVNTHVAYLDGSYKNVSQIISDLNYLGITQVRDFISNGEDATAPLSSYIQIANAGIHFTFFIENAFIGAANNSEIETQLGLINQVNQADPGGVVAIEGLNEINNAPITYNGVTGLQGALNMQAQLYADVQSDPYLAGVGVDYFTGYGAGSVANGPDPVASGLANFDNQHPYPNYGQAPYQVLARAIALTNTTNGSEPTVFTETGYASQTYANNSDQVDLTVQAKYTLDLIMDAVAEGVSKTFLYQLEDAYAPGAYQGDDGYGLFDYTGAAKPVAVAIHNLTTLLADTGANAASFTPTSLTYSVTGLPTTGSTLQIERSDGTRFLVVWAEPTIWNSTTLSEIAAPSESVTVSLPNIYSSVQVFDPLSGTSSIASYSNTNAVTVTVTDHPLLIELSASFTPGPTPPAVSISSEVLAADTGASASDNITSNGQVTLTGSVSGAAGTTVTLYDGSTALGSATLNGTGGWTFTTTLAAGAHSLSATATSPSGQTAASAAAAAITVITAAPSVTIAAPVQTANSTTVTLNGTITAAAGSSVAVYNGSTLLGTATVANGAWSYATSLSAGTYTFKAVATDLAGNTASAADPSFTVASASSPPSSSSSAGTQITAANLVVYNWSPATQLKDWLSAEAAVAAGTPGATAKIVAFGDLATTGVGASASNYRDVGSYPADLTLDLQQDTGVSTQSANFLGGVGGDTANGTLIEDNRITLINGAVWSGAQAAGGQVIQTGSVGAGFTFTLPQAASYNRVDIDYIDAGGGTASISINGAVVATIQLGNSGQMKTQTINLPLGSYSQLTVQATTSNPLFIEGAAFWNSTSPSIQVFNAGVAGASASIVNGGLTGWGEFQGGLALQPSLALLDFGAWDINYNTESVSQIVANIATMITECRSVNCDPIILIPQPFVSAAYASEMPQLRAALQALAIADNVPIIDLAATYGDNPTALQAAGFLSQNLAPTAALYADIASKIAALLAQSATSASSASKGAAPTVSISSEVLAADTGASASDNITSNGQVTLTGSVSGAAGTTVTLYDGSTALGSATLNGSGGWTFTTTLAAGAHSLSATATSPSGQTAASAAAAAITVITAAPTVTIAAPVQTANSTTVTLNGTITAAAGSSVAVYNGSTLLGAATVANGAWSYATSLPAGAYTFKAVATDLAGNTASASDPSFTVASTAPTVSISSEVLAADTGASASDNITSNGQVTLTGSVSGAAGTTVTLYDGSTALGSATLNGSGGWTFTTTLAAGAHSLSATATSPSGQTAASAAAAAITVITAAPTVTIAAPVQTANSTTVTLNGTITAAAGSSVAVYNGSTLLGTATVANGAWSYATSLSAGAYTFKAVATDLAGNTASASDPSFTVASTAPTVSISSEVLAADTGASASDNITSNGQVTLTGSVSGAAGTTVTLYDGSTALGSATLNGTGGWTFTTTLAAGAHSLSATATSPSGQTAASAAAAAITVITAAPSVTIAAPVQTANSTTVTLNGTITAAAGSSVAVYNGSTLLGTATVANGAWSYATSLSAGAYTFKAVATDLAGNTASASDPSFTVASTAPTVSISSEVLAADTGASASDNITSNGQVTLTGSVSGAAGTTVTLYDGSTALGSATLNGTGGWTFTTTLAAGAHSLSATATSPSGQTAASAAAAAITVITAAPSVTIAAPVQTANSTTVTLNGTITAAAGSSVAVYNGSTLLGTATVANGAWSYATSLSAGAYTFKAVATDLAGNTASASDPSFTVASASSPPSSSSSAGTQITAANLVVYNWSPATQLKDWLSAEAAVAAGTPGATAKIVAFGDLATTGVGASASNYRDVGSYPADLTLDLQQDTGVSTQSANFLGGAGGDTANGTLIEDNRITLINGAVWSGAQAAGGQVIQTGSVGAGFTFTLPQAASYNRVDIDYIDAGGGTASISINGAVVATIQLGNSGQMKTQTINLPLGSYSQLTVQATTSNPLFIEGAAFWNSTSPSIQVFNAGVAGASASIVNGGLTGWGEFQGGLALQPSLALLDFGAWDINYNTESVSQIVANIATMITECRSVNCDPIILIPQPFVSAAYASEMPQLRAALQALAIADNVPIIDLAATYGDNPTALQAAGLLSQNLAPTAALYADIASKIAALLSGVSQPTAGALNYVVPGSQTVTGGAGADLLLGASTNATLVGGGGVDTYFFNAQTQTETIVNGGAGSTAPAGVLDITAANSQQLWFQQSGSNLVIDVLGSTQQVTIQNWYANPSAQLSQIVASDGLKIDANLQALVQAMAAFQSAHPTFNPQTTAYASLSQSYFAGALSSATTSDWHK